MLGREEGREREGQRKGGILEAATFSMILSPLFKPVPTLFAPWILCQLCNWYRSKEKHKLLEGLQRDKGKICFLFSSSSPDQLLGGAAL